MWLRRASAPFVFLLLILVIAPVVQADPTDTGTIEITGNVAPQPTSIEISLEADPTTSVPQYSEITYTLTYRSSNVAPVPLEIGMEWEKGTVDGALEANVEVVEYVVGSATLGAGGESAIVDTINKNVTWDLSAVPGGVDHTVSFKLRTTDSYTGALPVTWTVRGYVLSPAGVPDETVTSTYSFDPSLVPTPTPTPLPTATPSPTPSSSTSTPTPAPTATAPIITNVEIRSIGANSARIIAETNVPSALQLSYGTSPTRLTTTLIQNEASLAQEFVLLNLLPGTRYYFQVSTLQEPAVRSDIFVFRTATSTPIPRPRQPFLLTVSHGRAGIYSDTVGFDANPDPMTVITDSVVDFSLTIPEPNDFAVVELLVRDQNVLGASTEDFLIDELQSTTTRLAETSPDIFMGKLRMPRTMGEYDLIIRLEDQEGNITEEKLIELWVVTPFTVIDSTTGEPVRNAKVFFSVYNENTRLFEALSNVTTTVANPAFTQEDGEVKIHLFRGRYKAEITQLGYRSQTVEFTVGEQPNVGLPRVALTPRFALLGKDAQALLGSWLVHTESFSSGLTYFAQSPRAYIVILSLAVLLTLGTVLVSLGIRKYPALHPENWVDPEPISKKYKVLKWIAFFIWKGVRFCSEVALVLCFVFGALFIQHQGILRGGVVLLLALLSVGLWSYDVIFMKTHPDLDPEIELKT
jgi:hypothetical protein